MCSSDDMTEKEVKDLSFLSATGDVNNSKKVRTRDKEIHEINLNLFRIRGMM